MVAHEHSIVCLQVVLTKDINDLGVAGDLVKVQHGYMFNFLYPKGLAKRATNDILEYALLLGIFLISVAKLDFHCAGLSDFIP
jgi:hypothetical protein